MDILNPHTLRERADRALVRGREPKKLVSYYAGIGMILSLLVNLAGLWLDEQISGTGGLSNLGTRAIFATAQQAIPLLSSFVAMCLELGYLGGMMRISRGQYADHTDLKVGFQKFWPLLRLTLLQGLIYLALGILAVQIGALIFTMSPWSEPMMNAIMGLGITDATALDEATMVHLMGFAGPMYIISGLVYLAVLLPFMFKMRMSYFCLLDDPKGRAMVAIRSSNKMMRRRFVPMLKIDLILWPYYLATVLMYVLMYGDLLLAALGISAPVDPSLLSLLFFIASLITQFVIQITLRNRVEATYLMAYDQLREKPKDSGGVVLGNIFDM